MITIQDTEEVNWNPVPLRLYGPQNWESHKPDNFGQIIEAPHALPGDETIPGIYRMPEALRNFSLGGTSGIHVIVQDTQFGGSEDITSECSRISVGSEFYLKVPPVQLGHLSAISELVFLRFTNLAANSNNRYGDWELVSEPYAVHEAAGGWTGSVENQNPVVLRWGDTQDFFIETRDGSINLPYKTANHFFQVMFPCQLSKPEYRKSQDGTERDGLFFAEKTVMTKEFHFNFLAPEYLLDALRFAQIADHVEVIQGRAHYVVDSIDFDINWEKDGSIAKVNCSFTTGTVVRKAANYYTNE